MLRSSSRSKWTLLTSSAITACLGFARFASADPLPGEQLKFFQSPLNGGAPGVYPIGATPSPTDTPAPFLGHDELSTATPTVQTSGATIFSGTMMADDFLDTNPLPIGHITFWGSYMNNTAPVGNLGITQFEISLYKDVPAIGTPGTPNFVPSHPGPTIVSQTVNLGALTPSSGTFTVKPVPANGPAGLPSQPGDSGLLQYNAELNWRAETFPDAFLNSANPDPVEWLSIVALSPVSPANNQPVFDWGWHDRDYGIADPFAPASSETNFPYHLLDDAVSGGFSLDSSGIVNSGGYLAQDYIPAYDGISSSKDLAFALYTVPEPTTLSLLALAAPALLIRRRRVA